MLHLTGEKDDLETVCRYRYCTQSYSEIKDYMGRVLEANPDKRAFVGGERPYVNQGYIPLSPNTFIWLPRRDIDDIDPLVAQDYQPACIKVNYAPPMNRFKLRWLLRNTRIDLELAASQAQVHIEQASLYLHHKRNKASNFLKEHQEETKAFSWGSIDRGIEHIRKEAHELHDAIYRFTDNARNYMVAEYSERYEPEIKAILKDLYKEVDEKYTTAMRVARRLAKVSYNLLVHRDLFHNYGEISDSLLWETSFQQVDWLTNVMHYAEKISHGMLALEIASDIHEVYEVYKEHGDLVKELLKIGGEVLGGMAVGAAAALALPTSLVGIVIAGGIGGVGGDIIGHYAEEIDYKKIWGDLKDETHSWIG